jgi:anthranilate synthase/phosphoribosyltransferase
VLGYQRAAVVHSGGMDEVSLHAPTLVAELRDGEILSYQLEAADFGLNAISSGSAGRRYAGRKP